jgi:hypothetical protein
VASGGAVLTVAEEELEPARVELAHMGMPVEPTAAAAWAAARRARPFDGRSDQITVVVLSGSAG